MEILEWINSNKKIGSGYDYGSCSDYGSGDGYVSGYGDGYASGKLFNIKSINGFDVYYIDSIPTIITNMHGNIARGKTVKKDLTFEDCYIAKGQGYFAHGKTIEEAVRDLQAKIFNDMDIEDKINEFWKVFNRTDKYKGTLFYDWHNKLTGSCEFGRKQFIEQNNLDLEREYSVKEFIELCENDYGGDIIKKLKEE